MGHTFWFFGDFFLFVAFQEATTELECRRDAAQLSWTRFSLLRSHPSSTVQRPGQPGPPGLGTRSL